jgi:hypothetical protein
MARLGRPVSGRPAILVAAGAARRKVAASQWATAAVSKPRWLVTNDAHRKEQTQMADGPNHPIADVSPDRLDKTEPQIEVPIKPKARGSSAWGSPWGSPWGTTGIKPEKAIPESGSDEPTKVDPAREA